jgi:rhodanese-related sulfurtransferase/predicted transcriptional regulator
MITDKRAFKDYIFGEIASIAKALSNANRVEIIDLLTNGEKTVEQISREVNITVANASQHLQSLKSLKIVRTRRQKNFIYYSITHKSFIQVWQGLRDFVLMNNAEVQHTIDEFRKGIGDFKTISLAEYMDEIIKKEHILIDVRPEDEFEHGHIQGAISIPIDQLNDHLSLLRDHENIVIYCRGPLCVFADQAASQISALGYNAFRMEEGYQDWELIQTNISE